MCELFSLFTRSDECFPSIMDLKTCVPASPSLRDLLQSELDLKHSLKLNWSGASTFKRKM